MDNRPHTEFVKRPDDVDPGLSPGGLVLRLVARCGTVLAGPAPIRFTDDADLLRAHHEDLVGLHLTECPCAGVELAINDGDDGTLIHTRREGVAEIDGHEVHVVMSATRPDMASVFPPDAVVVVEYE